MECFATADVVATVAESQRCLSITDLPRWYESVDKTLSDVGDSGEIYCVWGRFLVHREEIRDGLRFTLPGCPNACNERSPRVSRRIPTRSSCT